MIWSRVSFDDGEGSWLECRLPPLGELCIDSLQGPFQLLWFNGNGETVISSHATEAEAKLAGEQWLRHMEARIGNVLAQGFVQPDDGE